MCELQEAQLSEGVHLAASACFQSFMEFPLCLSGNSGPTLRRNCNNCLGAGEENGTA